MVGSVEGNAHNKYSKFTEEGEDYWVVRLAKYGSYHDLQKVYKISFKMDRGEIKQDILHTFGAGLFDVAGVLGRLSQVVSMNWAQATDKSLSWGEWLRGFIPGWGSIEACERHKAAARELEVNPLFEGGRLFYNGILMDARHLYEYNE